MSRIVDFYGKLPRGPAPEVKAKGLLGRYQARYFGKKPSAMRKSFEALYLGQTFKARTDYFTDGVCASNCSCHCRARGDRIRAKLLFPPPYVVLLPHGLSSP